MARKQLGTAAAGATDLTTRSDVLAMSLGDGCCRLSVASTTSLLLSPLNGNTLWVGGQACTIPASGVTLSGQTSLAAGTLYYVYAQASSGAVSALSLSTTGHIAGADGRHYLSSGGSTPSAVSTSRLVGMVYTNSASAPFLDSTAFRGCLNYFIRRNLDFKGPSTGGGSISAESMASNSYPATVLSWGDEAITATSSGAGTTSTANAQLGTQVVIDNTLYGVAMTGSSPAGSNNGIIGLAASAYATLSEGVHVVTPGSALNSGTGTITILVQGMVRG